MLVGQEMRWFLLVLLTAKRLPKGMDGSLIYSEYTYKYTTNQQR